MKMQEDVDAGVGDIVDAIVGGADGARLARMDVPRTYRAAVVLREDTAMFDGLDVEDRDPARSIRVAEVPTPELAPDEVLIAVMASTINYNTVWSSIFHPMPTFGFLRRLAAETGWGARHDRPYHVLGSDAAGVVLRTGSLVRRHRPGDHVVIHAAYVDGENPDMYDDAMLDQDFRAWGFETNFGGLAELSVVRANQIMPKPPHLTWEEAAVNGVCNTTAYRMLLSPHGANMKAGDTVLIWGATGGLGSYGIQYARQAGATAVCVAGSAAKVKMLRQLGCEHVIDRSEAGYRFWSDEHTQDPDEWRRFGKDIRALVGEDPRIVFEHPGRETMGASVFVARRGGVIVTCAATTGYVTEYDQRHLWMRLKTIRGSHIGNYAEAAKANELMVQGLIQPTLTEVYPLAEVGAATAKVHRNEHVGKIAIRCLAPADGLGVTDPAARQRIGTDRIMSFRAAAELSGLVPQS